MPPATHGFPSRPTRRHLIERNTSGDGGHSDRCSLCNKETGRPGIAKPVGPILNAPLPKRALLFRLIEPWALSREKVGHVVLGAGTIMVCADRRARDDDGTRQG